MEGAGDVRAAGALGVGFELMPHALRGRRGLLVTSLQADLCGNFAL